MWRANKCVDIHEVPTTKYIKSHSMFFVYQKMLEEKAFSNNLCA
jgi:hypothetical protein